MQINMSSCFSRAQRFLFTTQGIFVRQILFDVMSATVRIFNSVSPYPAIENGRNVGVESAVMLYMDAEMSFLEKMNFSTQSKLDMHLLKSNNLKGTIHQH